MSSGCVTAGGEYRFVVIGISVKESDDTSKRGRVKIGNGGTTADEAVCC